MYCSKKGFTLIELLVLISIIALLISILLPALGAARRAVRRMHNNTQLRGIHQGLVTFANSNRDYFAGLDSQGRVLANSPSATGNSGDGDTTEARYWIMLNGDFFTPEYIISPLENGAGIAEYQPGNASPATAVLWNTGSGTKNYSYTMLGIAGNAGQAPDGSGRAADWQNTINTQAIVLSDRNIGTGTTTNLASIHNSDGLSDEWNGGVLWGGWPRQFRDNPGLQDPLRQRPTQC